jgi:hypothetical protein
MDRDERQMRTRILRSGRPGRRLLALWERLSRRDLIASLDGERAQKHVTMMSSWIVDSHE